MPNTSLLLKEGKKLLPGEGKVGTFRELHNLCIKGDNLNPNHIPQSAYMQSYGVSHPEGIAIMME